MFVGAERLSSDDGGTSKKEIKGSRRYHDSRSKQVFCARCNEKDLLPLPNREKERVCSAIISKERVRNRGGRRDAKKKIM